MLHVLIGRTCFALLDWSCDLLFSPTLPMGVFLLVPNSFSFLIPVSSHAAAAEPPLPSHRSCDSVPAGAPHPSPPGLVRAFHTGEHCPARTAVTATLTTAALSTATAAPGLARCSSSVARVCPSPPTSFVSGTLVGVVGVTVEGVVL
ncbi:unnamed protein product, partial [Closterium sp. NIES-53]